MEQQNPSFIKNEFAALPILVKSVIILGGATAVFFAGRAIVKAIKGYADSQYGRQEEKSWGKLLNNSRYDETEKQSLSDAEISSIANRIHESMNGYGTRDADIIQAFNRIQTVGDLAALYKSFGIRTIDAGFGIGWASPEVKGTLSQTMVAEPVDSSTINTINQNLAAKGISVQI